MRARDTLRDEPLPVTAVITAPKAWQLLPRSTTKTHTRTAPIGRHVIDSFFDTIGIGFF